MTEATLQTQINSGIGGIQNVYNWNFLEQQYQNEQCSLILFLFEDTFNI